MAQDDSESGDSYHGMIRSCASEDQRSDDAQEATHGVKQAKGALLKSHEPDHESGNSSLLPLLLKCGHSSSDESHEDSSCDEISPTLLIKHGCSSSDKINESVTVHEQCTQRLKFKQTLSISNKAKTKV